MMPRKGKVDEQAFYNQVVSVFRQTTQEERLEAARAWCGNFSNPDALAARTGTSAIAVLVAALVDIEHPLVGNRRNVSVTSAALDILTAELSGVPVAVPVCTQGLCTPVDKLDFIHRARADGAAKFALSTV